MNATELASLDARKRRSPIAENERTHVRVETGRTLHALTGTKLCLSRERSGALIVWSNVGDHILQRYPIGGAGAARRIYPMAGTRLVVVREASDTLSVSALVDGCLGKRHELEVERP